jgi:repressor LexA
MQVAEVLHRIKEEMDWTQSVLAKRIDVSQGTISKWNSGQQSPNKAQWDRVIALIRREPRLEKLLSEVEPTGAVPVMGRIGAGSVIEPDFDQADASGLYDVTLPFPVPDEMIGLEVDGESMMPKYDPGDVVVVWREQRRDINFYIGQLAAVRTEDGRRFLKIILNGSREGLYRLESFNAKPIVDVSISWVGEIHVIVPASQVRHLGVRKQATSKKKATQRTRETSKMDELPLRRTK